MNLLEVVIILGSIIGSVTFSGGILWIIFMSWTIGFKLMGIGAVVIIAAMLTALIYYLWEVYRHGKV